MLLKNDLYEVTINKISELPTTEIFDYIYDFENYKNEEFKNILSINVVTTERNFRIALYCDFCGNYEACTILKHDKLIILKFNALYEFDLNTNSARHMVFSDIAGAIGLYDTGDGYLIHGEMCLIKTDYNLNKLWDFYGKDILVGKNGNNITVTKDKIELTDFEGNHYTIDLTDDFKQRILENNDRYCEFKKITENPIILDFSKCRYLGEIHLMLKEKFGLPEYYGENWDALWDCLRYLFDDKKYIVEVHNLNLLNEKLREECEIMLRVFDRVKSIESNFQYKIIS